MSAGKRSNIEVNFLYSIFSCSVGLHKTTFEDEIKETVFSIGTYR